MDFMESLKIEANKTTAENGAVGLRSTGKALTDFNFKLPSFRGDDAAISKAVSDIVVEKDPYLFKYLFFLRDCRGGLGERTTFRKALLDALRASSFSDDEVRDIIYAIPEYGRFDDLLAFFDTEYARIAMSYIKARLWVDLVNMSDGESVSLLAKWLPSDNASSKRSRYYAHKIAKYVGLPIRAYREILVKLRKYLDVLEVKASAGEWGEIDYNKVPSKANLRYNAAFMRHDKDRRTDYLNKLASGDVNVKMNSAVNFPHDIVHSYSEPHWLQRGCKAYDETLEQLWKNLQDMPGLDETLVVRDGSGSMQQHPLPGTSILALDVADALTIYCSERCGAAFKDTFITFSSKPQLVSLAGRATLHDKLVKLLEYDDWSNTNLEATFDLILRTAINAGLKQEELPKAVLVISDMEFDAATTKNETRMRTLMETISDKYAAAGYKLPKLVFWNVNSRSNVIPITENNAGVILVSGFSQNTLKLMLSGKTDPYEAIVDAVSDERYSVIPLAKY